MSSDTAVESEYLPSGFEKDIETVYYPKDNTATTSTYTSFCARGIAIYSHGPETVKMYFNKRLVCTIPVIDFSTATYTPHATFLYIQDEVLTETDMHGHVRRSVPVPGVQPNTVLCTRDAIFCSSCIMDIMVLNVFEYSSAKQVGSYEFQGVLGFKLVYADDRLYVRSDYKNMKSWRVGKDTNFVLEDETLHSNVFPLDAVALFFHWTVNDDGELLYLNNAGMEKCIVNSQTGDKTVCDAWGVRSIDRMVGGFVLHTVMGVQYIWDRKWVRSTRASFIKACK